MATKNDLLSLQAGVLNMEKEIRFLHGRQSELETTVTQLRLKLAGVTDVIDKYVQKEVNAQVDKSTDLDWRTIVRDHCDAAKAKLEIEGKPVSRLDTGPADLGDWLVWANEEENVHVLAEFFRLMRENGIVAPVVHPKVNSEVAPRATERATDKGPWCTPRSWKDIPTGLDPLASRGKAVNHYANSVPNGGLET